MLSVRLLMVGKGKVHHSGVTWHSGVAWSVIPEKCGLFTLGQTRKQKAQDIIKSGYHLQDLPQQPTLVGSAPPPKDSHSHKQHLLKIRYPDPTAAGEVGGVPFTMSTIASGLS